MRQTSRKLELKLMSAPSGLPFSSSVGVLKFFFIVDPPEVCEPLVSEAWTMRLASTGSVKEKTGVLALIHAEGHGRERVVRRRHEKRAGHEVMSKFGELTPPAKILKLPGEPAARSS